MIDQCDTTMDKEWTMEKDCGESTSDQPEVAKRVFTNMETFLQAILARFLENVDPIESGLVDNLRQDNVLGCDEEEAVRAEATRINKARKCWELLQAVQPAVFQRHCFPALEKFYPHVLQEAEFCWDGAQAAAELCLQHVIKKTCLRQFADLFKMTGACTHEEYCTVTEGSPNRAKWDLVFRLCQKHGENTEFVKQVKSKLISIQVEIPDNFHTLLSTGFPCVCMTEANTQHKEKTIGKSKKTDGLNSKQKKSMPIDVFSISATKRKKLEHDTKSEASESSSVYLPSTADDSRDKEKSSASISSGTSEKSATAEVSDHEIEETQFETEEQKETFLLEMEQINKAITKACSIRALYRELADTKEELSTLGKKAKSESETTTNRAFLNDGKMYRLQDRARNMYQTLKQSYEEVKKIAAEEFKFDVELPFTCTNVLLERRYIFVSEVTDATPFFQQAEMLFPTMSPVPVPWIIDDDDSTVPWIIDDDDSRGAIIVEDEHSSDSEDNDNYNSEDHISDLSSDDTTDANSGEGSENDDTHNLYGDDQFSDLLPGDNDLEDDDFDDSNDYFDEDDDDDDDNDDDNEEDDDNHEYDDPDNDDIYDENDEDY